MRTLSTFVVIAAVALVAGCRRSPTGPSLEYVEARGLYDRLIVNQGDDAYASERMAEVEALLKKVAPDSPDATAAKELLGTISAERSRVEEEARAAATPEPAPDLRAQFADDEEEAREGGAAPDAGVVEQPRQGMELSELRSKFSGCFSPGPQIMVQGLGLRESWVLTQSADCLQRHASFNGAALLIHDGKVEGFAKVAPNQPPPQAPSRPAAQAPSAPQAPPAAPPAGERGSTSEDYDSIKY